MIGLERFFRSILRLDKTPPGSIIQRRFLRLGITEKILFKSCCRPTDHGILEEEASDDNTVKVNDDDDADDEG